MGRIRKQINKLSVRQCKNNKYKVFNPDGELLKEFDELEQAEEYATSIKDFRKKQNNSIINVNDINELCNRVNEMHKLQPNSIGSIEYYHTMTENAIVQICNEYRGIRPLLFGTDTDLKKYLQGVLKNSIILKF